MNPLKIVDFSVTSGLGMVFGQSQMYECLITH